MSYVDSMWDRENDVVHVVERDPVKGRIFQQYPAKYVFYYPDNKGKHTSIFGTPLSKVTSRSYKDHMKEQRIHSGHKLFESDIKPVFRCLEENYLGKDAPKLNVAFFDIETDMQPYAYPSGHMVKIRPKSK